MTARIWLLWIWFVIVTGGITLISGHAEPVIGALIVGLLVPLPWTVLEWWDAR